MMCVVRVRQVVVERRRLAGFGIGLLVGHVHIQHEGSVPLEFEKVFHRDYI